jgi:hypothetical protein
VPFEYNTAASLWSQLGIRPFAAQDLLGAELEWLIQHRCGHTDVSIDTTYQCIKNLQPRKPRLCPLQVAGAGPSLKAAKGSKAEPASRQSPISTDTDVKMDQNAPTKSDSATNSGGVVNNTQPLTVSGPSSPQPS